MQEKTSHTRISFFTPVLGVFAALFLILPQGYAANRVFNQETKRRHTGLNFRAWEGTPIHCMAAGRVILVGSFLSVYSLGQTIDPAPFFDGTLSGS